MYPFRKFLKLITPLSFRIAIYRPFFKTLYPGKKSTVNFIEDFTATPSSSSLTFFNVGRSALISLPCYFPDKHPKTERVPMPPNRLLALASAQAIGGSNAVLTGGQVFLNCYREENIDYTDTAFLDWKDTHPISHPETIYISRMAIKSLPRAASIITNFSNNFYHFVVECLTKLWILEQAQIPHDIPVLIDAFALSIPQFKTYLHAIAGERSFVPVKRRERVRCGLLYQIGPVNIIPPNFIDISKLTGREVLFDMDSINFLRTKMIDSEEYKRVETTPTPRKIFISRKGNAKRQYNEEDVEILLSRRGFSSIAPQNLTVWEQISLFRHAECIVAASGAALTNVIYCQPGCRVIVLTANRIALTIFSSLAYGVGAEMIYLAGNPTNPKDVQSGFAIDIRQLDECISQTSSFKGDDKKR